MIETKELKVGVRIQIESGVELFGSEEVNHLIALGWSVIAIRPGGVVFLKTGESEGNVELTISGCDMNVILAPPKSGFGDNVLNNEELN